MNNISNKLELHYYFKDESHTMDAFVHNKCNAEILAIVKEIADLLDTEVNIESEALIEGGLKDRLILIAKNERLQGFIIGIISVIITTYLTTDRELVKLQKEELKLKIEQLKQELDKEKDTKNESQISIENATITINNTYKIIKRKSNFYSNLNSYSKVTQLSTSILSNDNLPIGKEILVNREEFDKFILHSDELKPDIEDNAQIEIISPVLKKGNYKWKGIYNGEIISFRMKDKSFKESVIREGVSFKNGTCIDCILEISKELNEFGDIIETDYLVKTVIRKHDEEISELTPQGKLYLAKKQSDKQQLKLFDGE